MTDDDERMDRARRIREMREGSRPQDDASNDDQPADSSADGAEADDADEPDADASADPAPDGGDADREAASEEDQPTDDADSAEDDGETRADDPADSTDDEPADAEADDVSADADDESADGEAVDDAEEVDDAESAAAAAAEAAAELSETDEGGTIHIPGADVGDVEVDVEEMARQAGLSSADGPDGDAGGEEDDGGVDPVAPGAAGRAEGAETQTGEETRVLEFALGDEQYCLDIEYVEEIVKRETVTRVPNTADCVEGVVDLRGQITTILDPKVLLDIPEEEQGPHRRLRPRRVRRPGGGRLGRRRRESGHAHHRGRGQPLAGRPGPRQRRRRPRRRVRHLDDARTRPRRSDRVAQFASRRSAASSSSPSGHPTSSLTRSTAFSTAPTLER
ncbi:chemotaxis protein CheW [Halosimplex aquaticum]